MPRPVQQLATIRVHCFYSPVVGLGQPRHAVVPRLERQAVRLPHCVAIYGMEFQLNSCTDDFPHVGVGRLVNSPEASQLDCVVAWGGWRRAGQDGPCPSPSPHVPEVGVGVAAKWQHRWGERYPPRSQCICFPPWVHDTAEFSGMTLLPRCCCLPCCLLVWAGCSCCPSWAGCCCCQLLPALYPVAVGCWSLLLLVGLAASPARLLRCLLLQGPVLWFGAGSVCFRFPLAALGARAGGALPGGPRTGLCTLGVFVGLPCPALMAAFCHLFPRLWSSWPSRLLLAAALRVPVASVSVAPSPLFVHTRLLRMCPLAPRAAAARGGCRLSLLSARPHCYLPPLLLALGGGCWPALSALAVVRRRWLAVCFLLPLLLVRSPVSAAWLLPVASCPRLAAAAAAAWVACFCVLSPGVCVRVARRLRRSRLTRSSAPLGAAMTAASLGCRSGSVGPGSPPRLSWLLGRCRLRAAALGRGVLVAGCWLAAALRTSLRPLCALRALLPPCWGCRVVVPQRRWLREWRRLPHFTGHVVWPVRHPAFPCLYPGCSWRPHTREGFRWRWRRQASSSLPFSPFSQACCAVASGCAPVLRGVRPRCYALPEEHASPEGQQEEYHSPLHALAALGHAGSWGDTSSLRLRPSSLPRFSRGVHFTGRQADCDMLTTCCCRDWQGKHASGN